jgi:PIN domain
MLQARAEPRNGAAAESVANRYMARNSRRNAWPSWILCASAVRRSPSPSAAASWRAWCQPETRTSGPGSASAAPPAGAATRSPPPSTNRRSTRCEDLAAPGHARLNLVGGSGSASRREGDRRARSAAARSTAVALRHQPLGGGDAREREHLSLDVPLAEWLAAAAHPRSVRLIPITPQIAAEVAALPAGFHRDPADRVIVATSRVLKLPLLTRDRLITASRLVTRWRPA